MKTKFITAAFAAGLLILGMSRSSDALTIIDERSWSGTSCGVSGGSGSGDCYGLTYHLKITDHNDVDASTFAAILDITGGSYTGTMTYIGAVDFKPGNVIGASLTDAPGEKGLWTTSFTDGQAATNCLQGNGGFLCSRDTGKNNAAPVTNGGAVDDHWAWDFSLSDAYTFGHFGVNFTVEDDSGKCGGKKPITGPDCKTDGDNLSIAGGGVVLPPTSTPSFDPPTPTTGSIPEPSTFLLLGSGLIALGRSVRKKGFWC
jgi:hypothetical protein